MITNLLMYRIRERKYGDGEDICLKTATYRQAYRLFHNEFV